MAVQVCRPKFVPKDRLRNAETKVLVAPPAELPIERSNAGPGLLANSIVRRWQDHQPLNRLEKVYEREGLGFARSTICGWHEQLAALARPLIEALWKDALAQPYLCTDATGVLVQAKHRCRHGHFWVVVAPELHVLYAYSRKHDSDAVDRILSGYKGYLVADAHAVYDHLYKKGDIVEAACWAHARRYYFKALTSEPDRATKGLAFINELFRIERAVATAPRKKRAKARDVESRRVMQEFFAWCDEQAEQVLEDTPIARAINYARNQREALQRCLENPDLPIHNNISELQLRREVVGRKSWLFLGSDDAAEVNTTFVTLLASCQLHRIEPWRYLVELLCLLPSWPRSRVLELAPAYWRETLEKGETQQLLAADPFRRAVISETEQHHASQ
jgi:hypothetical protein